MISRWFDAGNIDELFWFLHIDEPFYVVLFAFDFQIVTVSYKTYIADFPKRS